MIPLKVFGPKITVPAVLDETTERDWALSASSKSQEHALVDFVGENISLRCGSE